jgi:alpha-glucosidase
MQIGAFIPYFRNHTGVNTKSAEPWAFGEEALEITRNYVNLRYHMLPYLYSTLYAASRTGVPVMRTLALQNTFDPQVYDTRFQNQYQFGDAYMVAPFESTKDFGSIYFPKGQWYNLYTDAVVTGGQDIITPLNIKTLPVYVKESSIVPMQSLVQSTREKPADTLFLHLYKGSQPNTFVYYEDDGESFSYEKGDYYERTITYDPAQQTLTLQKPQGSYGSQFHHIKLILHGFDGKQRVTVNGSPVTVSSAPFSFLSPISRFDPQGSFIPAESCPVQVATFANSNELLNVGL